MWTYPLGRIEKAQHKSWIKANKRRYRFLSRMCGVATTVKALLSHEATRGLLATNHVILNHGQVTWTTPELAPPLLTTTPHQQEDVPALDRFNVHRCLTRRVFSVNVLELVTRIRDRDSGYSENTCVPNAETCIFPMETNRKENVHVFVDGI
ncbi:uncharacterized protein TNCV_1792281 [Trichonephila clavipes]|nr:uncharacterized protein TNCV_1792281 [Trichonephila clavipes]